MRFRPKMRPRGTQVYEDVPLEMFADRLPAWPGPMGEDSMSYSRDRSAKTRGVGAVASNDLRRDNGGGAKVRTARGAVVLVPSAERRVSRWGGPLPFGDTGLVRSAFKDPQYPTNRGRSRVVQNRLPVIIRAGGPLSPSRQAPWLDGQAISYAHPQVVSAGYGGRAYMGGGGGGIPVGLGAVIDARTNSVDVKVVTAAQRAIMAAEAAAALALAKYRFVLANPFSSAAAKTTAMRAWHAAVALVAKLKGVVSGTGTVTVTTVVNGGAAISDGARSSGTAVTYPDAGQGIADGARSGGSAVAYDGSRGGAGVIIDDGHMFPPSPEVSPPPVKPPIPTTVKVAAAAGIGWVLLQMLGKGH